MPFLAWMNPLPKPGISVVSLALAMSSSPDVSS